MLSQLALFVWMVGACFLLFEIAEAIVTRRFSLWKLLVIVTTVCVCACAMTLIRFG